MKGVKGEEERKRGKTWEEKKRRSGKEKEKEVEGEGGGRKKGDGGDDRLKNNTKIFEL